MLAVYSRTPLETTGTIWYAMSFLNYGCSITGTIPLKMNFNQQVEEIQVKIKTEEFCFSMLSWLYIQLINLVLVVTSNRTGYTQRWEVSKSGCK